MTQTTLLARFIYILSYLIFFALNIAKIKQNAILIFFKPNIEKIYIDKISFIYFWRNNIWVKFWNSAFISLFKFNHNIIFIAFANNVLILIYYITNNIIKKDYILKNHKNNFFKKYL